MQMPPRPFTAGARLRSIGHAVRGLRRLVAREHNARVHAAATGASVAIGLALRLESAEWTALLLSIGLIWTAEAVNTAIETLCDRLHPGFDPTIGEVKDLAAGAVLAAAVAAALTGALVILPHLTERMR